MQISPARLFFLFRSRKSVPTLLSLLIVDTRSSLIFAAILRAFLPLQNPLLGHRDLLHLEIHSAWMRSRVSFRLVESMGIDAERYLNGRDERVSSTTGWERNMTRDILKSTSNIIIKAAWENKNSTFFARYFFLC